MIARLWHASEERFAVLLQFLVLIDHDLVHKCFDEEQLGKSTNAATICAELTNQKLHPVVKSLKLYPMQAA